ncbi:hypothetical protein [Ramlibacter sp.]|uniref:hypothetical protein n=1 Tax=Ramlibacter sp. TaxID=1917967 RepID=UPI002FCAFB13
MPFRLFDPDDGRPRDPVLWLLAAAIAGAQLLALLALCNQQVEKAEARRTVVVLAPRPAAPTCVDPTSADCAVFYSPGQGDPGTRLAIR